MAQIINFSAELREIGSYLSRIGIAREDHEIVLRQCRLNPRIHLNYLGLARGKQPAKITRPVQKQVAAPTQASVARQPTAKPKIVKQPIVKIDAASIERHQQNRYAEIFRLFR